MGAFTAGSFPATHSAESDRRLLIVEDDEDFADSLSSILQPRGLERAGGARPVRAVGRASSGFAAEVALVDVRLGRFSGLDVVAQLKSRKPAILTVVMTAYVAAETAIEALRLGAYDYLTKPFEPSELWATLERCFDRIDLERARASAEAARRKWLLPLPGRRRVSMGGGSKSWKRPTPSALPTCAWISSPRTHKNRCANSSAPMWIRGSKCTASCPTWPPPRKPWPWSIKLQNDIWRDAVKATQAAAVSPAPMLLLPALNQMIDITTTRTMATQMHPPTIVFVLLFGLGLGCALMAGYAMAVPTAAAGCTCWASPPAWP